MAGTFQCSLVTPEAKLIDEAVAYASVPAWDGQMGIAPGRAPILARLGIGPLRLDFAGGASRWFMLEGGFVQMVEDRLTILSDKAWASEALIASDAAKELEAAREMPGTTDEQREAREQAETAAREKRRLAQQASRRGI